MDFDNLNARYEEEAEAAGLLRNQVSKITVELQNLRTKYDKDMMARAEELEDLRYAILKQPIAISSIQHPPPPPATNKGIIPDPHWLSP